MIIVCFTYVDVVLLCTCCSNLPFASALSLAKLFYTFMHGEGIGVKLLVLPSKWDIGVQFLFSINTLCDVSLTDLSFLAGEQGQRISRITT